MHKEKTYKRILLKLSGESLMGSQKFGVDYSASLHIANSIKQLQDSGLEVAIVIGGGNIFRGVNLKELGMQRTPADHIGMLATLINGITLQQSLLSIGCHARVMSALECPRVAEPYNWYHAKETLEAKNVLIFVGGTGNPYFTTDTAAAMRASEIHADALLKATKVDGIYNKDPLKYSDATKYSEITYSQVLAEKLEVMDATSIALCRNNRIPILVFNMQLLGKNYSVQNLTNQGTVVKGE
jgi:uridylate kinase